jgi:dTMP kinase
LTPLLSPIPKRSSLIAIIGTDGAGKTTQTQLLAEWLEAQGHAVITHLNSSQQPLRSVLADIAKTAGVRDDLELLGEELAQFLSNLLKWQALVDLIPDLDVPGAVVVADRYSYCYVAASEARGLDKTWIVRRMFDIFPEPDITIYLDVSPAEAARREAARDPYPQGLDFIKKHAAAYARLPEASSFSFVDANGTIEEVQSAIRAVVERELARRAAGT